jgi:hypothetical protein
MRNIMAPDLGVAPAPKPRQMAPRRRTTIGALVMDADYRGLALVRSLGRRGIPVWVLKHGDQLLATLSRYNRRTVDWPGQDGAENVDFLVRVWLSPKHSGFGSSPFPAIRRLPRLVESSATANTTS